MANARSRRRTATRSAGSPPPEASAAAAPTGVPATATGFDRHSAFFLESPFCPKRARFPVRGPVVGLFANQEIRLQGGPLFVGEDYLLEREVIGLSESRRVESSWVRTSIREAASERLVATTLLNSAVLKASYPGYDEERAALG